MQILNSLLDSNQRLQVFNLLRRYNSFTYYRKPTTLPTCLREYMRVFGYVPTTVCRLTSFTSTSDSYVSRYHHLHYMSPWGFNHIHHYLSNGIEEKSSRGLVPPVGLEPTPLTGPDLESGAAADFATGACFWVESWNRTNVCIIPITRVRTPWMRNVYQLAPSPHILGFSYFLMQIPQFS